MTLSSTSNRVDYTGNASTTAFAYTFHISATSAIEVYVAGTLKTLTTDYTVSGAGSASGGTVTFWTAPASGARVSLIRSEAYTQTVDLVNNDAFDADTLEGQLDKSVKLAQQNKELATRSWRFSASSPFATSGYVVDEPKAGTYPRVKSDCSGIEFVAVTSSGTYADPITTAGDLLIGNSGGCASRLAVHPDAGATLMVQPHTGLPGYSCIGVMVLTNFTDAQIAAGEVVSLAANCDRAVVANDVVGCTASFVVAAKTVDDDCQGVFIVTGLARNVKAQGTITRGDYVRKSATSKALETTGVRQGSASAPIGTVGVALTTAAASLVDVQLFGTPVTSRVNGSCGTFAKFSGSGCELANAVLSETDNAVTSTLPLIVPSAGTTTPAQHALYRESGIRAFVVFDGTSATASGDSPSPSNAIQPALHMNTTGTVTKLATGDFCASFLRSFSCGSYVIMGSAASVAGQNVAISPVLLNSGCVRFQARDSVGNLVNPTFVSVAFVGTQ